MEARVFPKGFVWGAATAAYQIEGAVSEDGRGESIWDRFCRTPGNILGAATGEVACDHYHRWREDVALMKRIGLKAYRFSIAWPRVFPEGRGAVNPKGLEFYSNLVDALLENGIEPYVTLYHWDLPQALQDRGGWTNRDTARRFEEYAVCVFEALGGRVRHFITLNEPWVCAFPGHFEGSFAPGLRDFSAALAAAHHLLMAHGLAVKRFRETGLPGEIGVTLNLCPRESASERAEDVEAARINDGYANRWFLDPLFKGAYPRDMTDFYRGKGLVMPRMEPGDMELIRTPFDFLGVNYYTVEKTVSDPSKWPLGFRLKEAEAPRTNYGWAVVPGGLTDLLTRLDRDYGHPAIYVTENGASYLDAVNLDGEVWDDARADYILRHAAACHDAISRGVDLRGYFVWSLMDTFEWNTGYENPFGLVHIDRRTLSRTLKRSGARYGALIARNALPNFETNE
jgi:beta-glucosidase